MIPDTIRRSKAVLSVSLRSVQRIDMLHQVPQGYVIPNPTILYPHKEVPLEKSEGDLTVIPSSGAPYVLLRYALNSSKLHSRNRDGYGGIRCNVRTIPINHTSPEVLRWMIRHGSDRCSVGASICNKDIRADNPLKIRISFTLH